MLSTRETVVNRRKVEQLEMAWSRLLVETLQRGFHGAATLEIAVQDGTIQCIRQRLERMEK